MNQYPKIQTIWKRDQKGNILLGEFSRPEFQYLAQNEWEFTEKVDGTNVRIMWDTEALDRRIHTLKFGGKTDRAQMPVKLLEALQETFTKEKFEGTFLTNESGELDYNQDISVCLYGEGHGAGIQKGGGLYRQDNGFVLFDIWVNGWWLKREDIEGIASKLDIDIVPIVGRGNLYDMTTLCQTGQTSKISEQPQIAEGIVARPVFELRTRRGDRIITKLKWKDFQ